MNEPQIKINVSKLFNALENIKIYHWVTTDYQTHVFLDDFHENISKIIDELV